MVTARFALLFGPALAASAMVATAATGCSSSSSSPAAPAADSGAGDGGGDDGGPEIQTTSSVKHLVVVVQENHSFDAYFGSYCTAAAGSNPTCTTGPSCCEAAPAKEPSGASPVALDDSENGQYDPNHMSSCETSEIDDGKMDMFVAGPNCANAHNFAIAPADSPLLANYRAWASQYAMADRYFQPIIGASSSNDMYFARAQYVFTDNTETPKAIGLACHLGANGTEHSDPTIADLLAQKGATLGWYGEGYQAAKDASPNCPQVPAECSAQIQTYPCVYDPGDVPFAFYPSTRDAPSTMHDFSQLATDLAGNTLPSVAFVKAIGYRSEHPGLLDSISAGQTFVKGVVDAVLGSDYADDTLVLVTYDESGGYFDHVTPPAANAADKKPYGPRIPFLALGKFAKKNYVSHVTMEHSTVVKFIEWNWLGGATGQLGGRDANVANIGSVLDPAATGVAVPEN